MLIETDGLSARQLKRLAESLMVLSWHASLRAVVLAKYPQAVRIRIELDSEYNDNGGYFAINRKTEIFDVHGNDLCAPLREDGNEDDWELREDIPLPHDAAAHNYLEADLVGSLPAVDFAAP